MKIIISALLIVVLTNPFLQAQQQEGNISGTVYEMLDGEKKVLTGANVYWSGTTKGTITNQNGWFELNKPVGSEHLVISFIGYRTDTLKVENQEELGIQLHASIGLDEVQITSRQKSTELSMINPLKVEKIGQGELEKAACCNLSESFETNPSVDVAFSDAITGTKQIQMLGLAGPYTQITQENIPAIRGLLAIYGMEYIPGPWIEGIQLNKGTGSVINGFESIAGQINVELHKPQNTERLYLNVFANTESRTEANLSLAHKINENWSTGLMLHGRKQFTSMDNNNDNFIDKPIGEQFVLLNRWKYSGDAGWQSQAGIKFAGNSIEGGQMEAGEINSPERWKFNMKTQGAEGWMKLGRVFPKKPWQSFGLQLAGSNFSQESKFGRKNYEGSQQSAYANFIFQSILDDTRHTYRIGASFQFDELEEQLDSLEFIRQEIVPGVFAEYTFSPTDKFDVVAGIRGDYHNQYRFFITPRLHLRYAITNQSVVRFSAGRGQRTASPLTEHSSVMASSRRIIFEGDNSDKPYGFDPEVAWNIGTNFTQKFRLDYREGSVSFDLYHTLFTQQVVTDLDANPREVTFYNLDGKSYSTSFQSQFDYELIRRLDVRLAYRWFDVKTEYREGLLQKPLVAQHRSFLNLAYATRNHWKFDYTVQWYGQKRLPGTNSNPQEYQLEDFSPSFFVMNAQVSKQWRKVFEIYLGMENILDYKQPNPILASNDPFGPYFDSSLIWGPVFGRMVYMGLRLKIK